MRFSPRPSDVQLKAGCTHPSIPNLLRTGGPLHERDLSVVRYQSEMRNPSQLRRLRNFAIDESIVEADLRRLDPRVGVIDALQSRPIDRGEAHRAGLAARVDVAVRQVESTKQRASATNGHDLGMRSRVIARRDLIPTLGDNRVVADNDRTEWSTAIRAHFFKR
jgi:hypothetical protein